MGAKWKGLDTFESKLDLLEKVMVDAAKEADETNAVELTAMQSRFVGVNTGKLKNSIKWKLVDRRLGHAVLVTAGGGDVTYAREHEFGNSTVPGSSFFYVPYWALRTKMMRRRSRKIRKALKPFK